MQRCRPSHLPTNRPPHLCILRPTDLRIFASSHLRTFACDPPNSFIYDEEELEDFPIDEAATAEEPHPDETDEPSLTDYVSIVMATFSLSTSYGDGFGQLGPVPFYASPSTCPLVTVVAMYLFSSRLSLHFFAVTATSTSPFGALRSTFGYGDTFTAILQICASRSVPIILTPLSIPGIS